MASKMATKGHVTIFLLLVQIKVLYISNILMLNPYTLNIQESLKHAWHWCSDFLRCLAAKVLRVRLARCGAGLHPPVKYFTDHSKAILLLWIICVIYALCLSCFRICSLLPYGHPGKG